MNEKLALFEFFHKLKNFTTISYSAKKLQDMLERELENRDFDLSSATEWIEEWKSMRKEMVVSMDEIDNLIDTFEFEKVGLHK